MELRKRVFLTFEHGNSCKSHDVVWKIRWGKKRGVGKSDTYLPPLSGTTRTLLTGMWIFVRNTLYFLKIFHFVYISDRSVLENEDSKLGIMLKNSTKRDDRELIQGNNFLDTPILHTDLYSKLKDFMRILSMCQAYSHPKFPLICPVFNTGHVF